MGQWGVAPETVVWQGFRESRLVGQFWTVWGISSETVPVRDHAPMRSKAMR
ncbi:hypothetical protein [Sulfobacillus thermosulfidooxidans]|uniref:hypothetical protein n=1 Tax=Sulfobacillus thermosulfidooxidans TaxID=28034 RepID=UPI000A43B51C|nr:hypothetical protein [Sulfobacillus thermosulfidooxidans]